MLKSFSSTVKGKIIQVDYFLNLHVRYDAWNDVEGDHFKTLSIDILQPPTTNMVQQLPDAMVPADWNPAVQQTVHFGLPADQENEPAGQATQVMMPQQQM